MAIELTWRRDNFEHKCKIVTPGQELSCEAASVVHGSLRLQADPSYIFPQSYVSLVAPDPAPAGLLRRNQIYIRFYLNGEQCRVAFGIVDEPKKYVCLLFLKIAYNARILREGPVSWPAARKCLDLGIDKASVHPFCIVSCGALFHPSFQSSGSLHPEVCSLQPLPWVVEKIYAPILAAEHLLFSTNDAKDRKGTVENHVALAVISGLTGKCGRDAYGRALVNGYRVLAEQCIYIHPGPTNWAFCPFLQWLKIPVFPEAKHSPRIHITSHPIITQHGTFWDSGRKDTVNSQTELTTITVQTATIDGVVVLSLKHPATFNGRGVPLCLHGNNEIPDELFGECVKSGVSRFIVNSWGRDPYVEALAAAISLPTDQLPFKADGPLYNRLNFFLHKNGDHLSTANPKLSTHSSKRSVYPHPSRSDLTTSDGGR
ncbi:uncharacterized protein BT62DRAFT_1009160 [Guyanagaster necrorhizus]|uniref:Uncharacterized protein n=1 Tax=Guyanagaster necrorhizus TaxID=856835 RepID=A0A9P7VMV1_9AGAR|nr:uncharacterized protein BT62DRAFT_1009160 [Guyanagaster necrorhizus MCA 3950]KAG7443367.1 hypothetical protein BT62DRAFT_1009160 [Guyanagaster necrorhizus MCA 3950]